MLRLVHDNDQPWDDELDPIPFPVDEVRQDDEVDRDELDAEDAFDFAASPDEILDAIDDMSRHIDDLAREFNCPGQFESDDFDDDGPPRAA
jgi:hypothetical protein